MSTSPRAIYLLADSQLLFRGGEGGLPLPESLGVGSPRAAYLGASNGDDPASYAIFEAAMEAMGITRYRWIREDSDPTARRFLESADLVVLGGGEVERGFRSFESQGLVARLGERFRAGTTLLGVSAGAVQLGLGADVRDGPGPSGFVSTFGFVPFLIGAHEEVEGFGQLRRALRSVPGARALQIPRGGGAIYHPDGTLEPVRFPLTVLALRSDTLEESLVLPPGPREDIENCKGASAE